MDQPRMQRGERRPPRRGARRELLVVLLVVLAGGAAAARGATLAERSAACRARAGAEAPAAAPQSSTAGAAQDASAGQPDPPFDMVQGDGIVHPKGLYVPAPQYCKEARHDRTQGVVVVATVIDRDGCLEDLHILKSLTPCLDKAALTTLAGWVYQPATRDGQPVAVHYKLTVTFSTTPGS